MSLYEQAQTLQLTAIWKSSSSSSSATVQGSVSLPHYRTLEVRPRRISYKLNYDYGSKEMMWRG